MSDIDKMLADTNSEMEKSKRVLQDLANELTALVEIVQPALERQTQALRNARMTAVAEVTLSLQAFRDLRKFFIEDDYEKQMQRLERFVDLCLKMKALKDDGTLDAVADTALRMAVK